MTPEIDHEAIRQAVRRKYAEASQCLEGLFGYPTGKAGAEGLGYDPAHSQAAPEAMIERFCGVGHTFSLAALDHGETVLDIGCGAGFDLFCAARMVGLSGQAHGIDLTPAMVETARSNLALAGIANAVVQLGCAEGIPFRERLFDVVISNGVLNLSPDKERSFAEIFRVLRPGGRLQFADIVLEEGIPPQAVSAASWSN